MDSVELYISYVCGGVAKLANFDILLRNIYCAKMNNDVANFVMFIFLSIFILFLL